MAVFLPRLGAVCGKKAQRWSPCRAEIEVVKVQVQDPVARDQSRGGHAISRMYEVVQPGESLSTVELQLGETELKKLYAKREALRIRIDSLIVNQNALWCAVCPPATCKTVVWETHRLAHTGMSRTVARL